MKQAINFFKSHGYSIETSGDLKKAYKKLAILLHPDKSTGSTEDFQNLSKQNEILKDVFKDYDTITAASKGNWNYYQNFHNTKYNPPPEDDIPLASVNVKLSMEEFEVGCKKIIKLQNKQFEVSIKPGYLPSETVDLGEVDINGRLYKVRVKLLLDSKDISFNKQNNKPYLLVHVKQLTVLDILLGAKIVIPLTSTYSLHVEVPQNYNIKSKLYISGNKKRHGITALPIYLEFTPNPIQLSSADFASLDKIRKRIKR